MTWIMWIALSSPVSTLLPLSTEHKHWITDWWWCHPAFGFDDTVRLPSGPGCVSHSLGRERQRVNSAWPTYPYLSSSLRTLTRFSLLIDRRRVEHSVDLRISSMHPVEMWEEQDWRAMIRAMLVTLSSPISTLLLLSTEHKQRRAQWWQCHPAFGFDGRDRWPSGPDCVSHSLGREKQRVNSSWKTSCLPFIIAPYIDTLFVADRSKKSWALDTSPHFINASNRDVRRAGLESDDLGNVDSTAFTDFNASSPLNWAQAVKNRLMMMSFDVRIWW